MDGRVYELYLKLIANDSLVSPGQAKKWLSDVEGNLGMMLEIIGPNDDEQQMRCMLGVVIDKLVPIIFMVEGILAIVYTAEQMQRDEGEPVSLLAKLRQMCEQVGPLRKPLAPKRVNTSREQPEGP